jgi:hypothetical protein
VLLLSEDEGTGYDRAGKIGEKIEAFTSRQTSTTPLTPTRSQSFNWTCIRRVEKMSQDQAEQNIQMWKVKKLIKSLDSARGCTTPSRPMSCPTTILNRD